MGFRVMPSVGMVPICMKFGVLHFYRDMIEPIELPAAYKTVNFDMQCNPVSNISIRCYLKSDKYEFVMWDDGSCVNLTLNTRYIVHIVNKGEVMLPNIGKWGDRIMYGGVMCTDRDPNIGVGGLAFIYESVNGDVFLFAERCPIVAIGLKRDTYYFKFRKRHASQYTPFIFYEDNKLLCNIEGCEYPIECDELLNVSDIINLKGVL